MSFLVFDVFLEGKGLFVWHNLFDVKQLLLKAHCFLWKWPINCYAVVYVKKTKLKLLCTFHPIVISHWKKTSIMKLIWLIVHFLRFINLSAIAMRSPKCKTLSTWISSTVNFFLPNRVLLESKVNEMSISPENVNYSKLKAACFQWLLHIWGKTYVKYNPTFVRHLKWTRWK